MDNSTKPCICNRSNELVQCITYVLDGYIWTSHTHKQVHLNKYYPIHIWKSSFEKATHYMNNVIWVSCKNYVSHHFGGETYWYCFCSVRLSVTRFVSATPLKLRNRISWNLVGSMDTICSCAYYQEVLIP